MNHVSRRSEMTNSRVEIPRQLTGRIVPTNSSLVAHRAQLFLFLYAAGNSSLIHPKFLIALRLFLSQTRIID